MKRFIEGVDRSQATLFPDRLEDWVGEDNAVRVVDVYVDGLGQNPPRSRIVIYGGFRG